MITDKSKVIRPTFYHHFKDKYEVLEYIVDEDIMKNIYEMVDSDMEYESLKIIFIRLEKNREFIKKAFKVEGQNSFKEILGYKIDKKQSFEKIMQLLPPDDQSPLLNNSSEKPTHEAYVLVLVGDIALYKDDKGNDRYQIVNAKIDYYKQSLLLEEEYNSVYIASIDGRKEKMVKFDEYKEALSSVDTYMTMLQW